METLGNYIYHSVVLLVYAAEPALGQAALRGTNLRVRLCSYGLLTSFFSYQRFSVLW